MPEQQSVAEDVVITVKEIEPEEASQSEVARQEQRDEMMWGVQSRMWEAMHCPPFDSASSESETRPQGSRAVGMFELPLPTDFQPSGLFPRFPGAYHADHALGQATGLRVYRTPSPRGEWIGIAILIGFSIAAVAFYHLIHVWEYLHRLPVHTTNSTSPSYVVVPGLLTTMLKGAVLPASHV